ncbi:Hsp70 family protein [Microbacterium sp. OR21]|uniref:Hsp70 family protein n=1 Tax=Microbacterium sp. OR21 TaxID=3095346 RepID=UPI0039B6A28A
MGTAELLLALDAGHTRLHAMVVSAGADDEAITRRLRLGADRDEVSAGAFITEDGEVLFGDEAQQRALAQPEWWVRDVVSHVGDPVPLVVGGFAVPAEELVARMVRWAVAALVAAHGAAPSCIAVTHPTGWRGHRIGALRAALQAADVGDVLLVPAGYAAARHAAASGRARVIAVYDLGGETFEASVLDGAELAGPPSTLALGTTDLDLSLLEHVVAVAGGAGTRRPGTAGELVASRASVSGAKEELSHRSDAAVALRLRGTETQVRLTRAELEDAAEPMIERTVDALDRALDDAGVRADQLDEIVLVGGGSRLPLVAQTLSRRMDRPLTAPDDPQFAAALGAGLIAWEHTADRRRERAAIAPPEAAPPERTPLLAALLAGIRGVRVPYGAATALVAAGVIIAAGMVFGAGTPMNESISTAAGAAGADAEDDVGVRRATSGFSAADSEPADDAAEETDGAVRAEPDAEDPAAQATDDEPESTPAGGGFRVAPADDPAADADPVPSGATGSSSAPQAAGGTGTSTGSGSAPQPTTEPAPQPVTEPTAGPTPQPAPEPEPGPAPAPAPEPEPTQDPEPAPAPEPTPEPEPTPDPVTDPASGSEPEPQPTPDPGGPTPEPTLSAEPLAEPA